MKDFVLLVSILFFYFSSFASGEGMEPNSSTIRPMSFCPLTTKNINSIFNDRKVLKVLSIDGGGVSGIIPARILAEFEKRSGKPVSKLFDLVVGNSTGGLISLLLTTPNESQQSRYKAIDIVNLYRYRSWEIFQSSIFRKIYTGFGLWEPKYNRDIYDKLLGEYLGDTRMSQLLMPTGIITYNLNSGLPTIWSRDDARKNPYKDLFIKDIAAATTAAPTYFAPKVLVDGNNKIEYHIDGAVYENNPASASILMAFELDSSLTRQDIILLSLGTVDNQLTANTGSLSTAGLFGWLITGRLIDVMVNAVGYWETMAITFPNSCRIQLPLKRDMLQLDNASNENLESLLKVADDYINDNSGFIDHIVNILTFSQKI